MHAVRQPQHLVQNEMKASSDMQATTAKLMLVERPAPAPLDRKPALSMASIERVRSTSATLRRIENMQKLIGELQLHEMLADEIAWFLKFSPSGARKYIRDLREAGVIELARYVEGTATYLGKAVYQLTPDPDRVRLPGRHRPAQARRRAAAQGASGPARTGDGRQRPPLPHPGRRHPLCDPRQPRPGDARSAGGRAVRLGTIAAEGRAGLSVSASATVAVGDKQPAMPGCLHIEMFIRHPT